MFAKLLKYDMRSAFRVWWILAAVLCGATAVSAFALRFCFQYVGRDYYSDAPIFSMLAFMITMGYFFIISFSAYGILIPIYIRFYKHLYTDEGYLTFTLPVKRSTILLSKTVNNFIFSVIHAILILLCLVFVALIASVPQKDGSFINLAFFDILGDIVKFIWVTIGAWSILYFAEVILLSAALTFFNISMIQFCITVGSVVVKKHKLLAAVGIYLGTNFIVSVISRFISIFAQIFVTGGMIEIFADVSANASMTAFAFLLFGVFAAVLTVAFVFYFATLNTLERKLNLA